MMKHGVNLLGESRLCGRGGEVRDAQLPIPLLVSDGAGSFLSLCEQCEWLCYACFVTFISVVLPFITRWINSADNKLTIFFLFF